MKSNMLSVMTAVVMMGASVTGCALSGDELKEGQATEDLIAPSAAFVLHLSTETAPQDQVDVTSSDGTPLRQCFGGCSFAYLAGAALTLRVPFPTDKPNCIVFNGWTGACAGQGSTCNLVLNSDLTTEAIWAPIRGCHPQ